MPREWHDRHAVNKMEDDDTRRFYRSIVADKKPYFMRYIYPTLSKQYNTYIRNTNQNSLREFGLTVTQMRVLPYDELTERQRDFLRYYDYRMPVGVGSCVMNKICRRFEEEFDGYVGKRAALGKYDYSFMKSDATYASSQYYAIKRLYDDYNKRLRSYAAFAEYERVDKDESVLEAFAMNSDFRAECAKVCPSDSALCNILLDICYSRSATKKFVWSMCSHTIIHNLLAINGNRISFPTADPNGEVHYGGGRYLVKTKQIEVNG